MGLGKNTMINLAAIACGSCIIVGGIAFALNDAAKTVFEEQKGKLETKIAVDLKYTDVKLSYFDLKINDDNQYLLEFSGNAMNLMGEELDFFSCAYEVNEEDYMDVLSYVKKSDLNGDLAQGTTQLLTKLNDIVEKAELVEFDQKENVAISNTRDSERIILAVSKPKISSDKVIYHVRYAKPVKDENGNLGLATVEDEVSYDLDEELAKNPNTVFALGKEKASVKIVAENFIPISEGSIVQINRNI